MVIQILQKKIKTEFGSDSMWITYTFTRVERQPSWFMTFINPNFNLNKLNIQIIFYYTRVVVKEGERSTILDRFKLQIIFFWLVETKIDYRCYHNWPIQLSLINSSYRSFVRLKSSLLWNESFSVMDFPKCIFFLFTPLDMKRKQRYNNEFF